MYVEVLIQFNIRSLDYTFTYKVPKELENSIEIGKRVKVPFRNKNIEGFILDIKNNFESDYQVKNIIEVIDKNVVLNDELLKLGEYISKKTMCTKISAYQTMLPKALKAKEGFNQSIKYEKYIVVKKEVNDLTSKQKEIYDFVVKNKKVLKKELTDMSLYVTNKLLEQGVLEEIKEEIYRLQDIETKEKTKITLTDEQKNVINSIEYKYQPYLLYGVTGSGKTVVYMELIEKVIKNNKTAIVLVPEISLTPQLVSVFKKRFGNDIAILHSGLSDGEKYDEWRKIERGEVSIVIGARSAIFAPLNNLGIIIIDEEHSSTYKQENHPRYHAIDVALFRSKYNNCPLILGSATPSIESYTRAKLGIYKLLEMKNRINKSLPNITLVDMKDEFRKGNKIISELLEDKIREKLSKNEQIIILLNRRGYSTVLTCSSCGETIKCPNCDIPLTYHKTNDILRCHYCGHAIKKEDKCPNCKSDSINEYGTGTEKLEQILNEKFNARIIRMDTDTTSKKGSHKQIIEDFKNRKYDILLGTQMIAKGLDFPYVTLVGVINGDASLNVPDFRSAERTFQLLNQVSGRSGRGELSGDVIIQGFNMDHYSIVKASENDYEGFYNKEIEIRKVLCYPPYYDLCLVKISGKNYDIVNREANKISVYLKNNSNNIILGPSNASLYKINNIFYMQIIIKYKKIDSIKMNLNFIKEKYLNNKDVDIEIDNNPIKI